MDWGSASVLHVSLLVRLEVLSDQRSGIARVRWQTLVPGELKEGPRVEKRRGDRTCDQESYLEKCARILEKKNGTVTRPPTFLPLPHPLSLQLMLTWQMSVCLMYNLNLVLVAANSFGNLNHSWWSR